MAMRNWLNIVSASLVIFALVESVRSARLYREQDLAVGSRTNTTIEEYRTGDYAVSRTTMTPAVEMRVHSTAPGRATDT